MIALDFVNQLVLANKGKIQKLDRMMGLPAWITASANFFVIRVDEEKRIYLIEPKTKLAFDQLVNIHRQVEKRLRGVVLLIADKLNTKFRSPFVKNNIPFVYKGKSLFAPTLGLKLFDYKEGKEARKRVIEEAISPFELKLIEGFLTGFIKQEKYNLDQLILILSQNQYECSKTKLSHAVKHLIEMDFMTVDGHGPNRQVMFNPRDQIWEELKQREIKPFLKRVEAAVSVTGRNFIYSGETALAHYSDLSSPEQKHIGITNKELADLESKTPEEDTTQSKVVFEVFKESPRLFARDGYLSPIEVFMTFKNHPDERIHMSLEQMLSAFQLGDKHGAA